MASTTFNGLSLSHHQPAGVGAALQELLMASRHLATALWQAAAAPLPDRASALADAEDAEAVRAYASRIQHTDPGFAADLFAAADRYEQR
jgi:hypothetical protein